MRFAFLVVSLEISASLRLVGNITRVHTICYLEVGEKYVRKTVVFTRRALSKTVSDRV